LAWQVALAGDISDSLPAQEEYRRQIDGILRVSLQNPAILHLSTKLLGRNPQTIYQSLAVSKTLTSFHFALSAMDRRHPLSQEMAMAVAGGLTQNTSIKNVDLEALVEDPLHIIMSGIGGPASSIESLSISFERPNTEFGLAIARVLHSTPFLKQLAISVKDRRAGEAASHDAWTDQVLYSLRQPFCASSAAATSSTSAATTTTTTTATVGTEEEQSGKRASQADDAVEVGLSSKRTRRQNDKLKIRFKNSD
jgi:hypothetical protein